MFWGTGDSAFWDRSLDDIYKILFIINVIGFMFAVKNK
jgi:hypothetical protein